jgi:hypothetical protein
MRSVGGVVILGRKIEIVFWDERFNIFTTVRRWDRDEFGGFLECAVTSAEIRKIFESLNNIVLGRTKEGIANIEY